LALAPAARGAMSQGSPPSLGSWRTGEEAAQPASRTKRRGVDSRSLGLTNR